jgi:hypothetical protein
MVLETKASDQPVFFGFLASVAHGHQLCSELPIHRHHFGSTTITNAVLSSSTAGE